jgi:hypothetical protein
VTHGSGPDSREALGRKPRTLLIPDLRREAGIKPATRDFH